MNTWAAKQNIKDLAVRFLVWLPNWSFALLVRMLVGLTNLCYLAAKEEIRRQRPSKGLSKKHLEMLYEVCASNERAASRG